MHTVSTLVVIIFNVMCYILLTTWTVSLKIAFKGLKTHDGIKQVQVRKAETSVNTYSVL